MFKNLFIRDRSRPVKRKLNKGTRARNPIIHPGVLYPLLFALFCALAFLTLSLSQGRKTFVALLNPEHLFEQRNDASIPLEEKKTKILEDLNQELTHHSSGKELEESRMLSRLDRLWRSFRKYVSTPATDKTTRSTHTRTQFQQTEQVLNETENAVSGAQSAGTLDSEHVLYDVLTLSSDQTLIRKASIDSNDTELSSQNPAADPVEEAVLANLTQTTGSDINLYRFEQREGFRTHGIVWRLHRNLALEGTLDATPVGETESHLHDFGFRSVHALTYLRGQSMPVPAMGLEQIDSNYPASYGIGLNYSFTPSMCLLFDYSQEFPNDSYFDYSSEIATDELIDYKENQESSFMAEYNTDRPEDTGSTHNFFFGLHYLHRKKTSIIPFHTGFFYSTNMMQDPLLSDVSVGFSIGSGYHQKDFQLGVSYRLRIWETPEETVLNRVDGRLVEDRISNQLLFMITF